MNLSPKHRFDKWEGYKPGLLFGLGNGHFSHTAHFILLHNAAAWGMQLE